MAIIELLNWKLNDYREWLLARSRMLEPLLSAHPFPFANRFSAADVSVGYALLLAEHLKLSEEFPFAIATYWQRLRSRDAFQRAIAAQAGHALDQGVAPVPAPDTQPFA